MRRIMFGLFVAAITTAFVNPVVAQQKQPASPKDTVSATVGGAKIDITYGRPYKKGRQIWGGPLLDFPNKDVWRLGANEATTMKTSAPIQFGSVTVPAGEHTLYFAHPKDGQQALIINNQTGQWGTEYSEKQDLGRVPLEEQKLPSVVEQLTISIEPQGNGGVLKIAWDDRAYTAPFTVQK